MQLNKKAFSLTAGILWGAAIFLATNFLLLKGSTGGFISNLGNVYFGYSFSFLGSIIGLIWGFVNGFVAGWLFALLYNLFIKKS